MNFPSPKIPREYSKITVPLGPVKCREEGCYHVGTPIPVMTCLGDFALRLGGFCEKCRRLTCLLDMTLENLDKAGMNFLTYEQKVPKEGYTWPSVPPHFFALRDFPFGANNPGGTQHAPQASEPQQEVVADAEELGG
mgnify:CR=1 FL=1